MECFVCTESDPPLHRICACHTLVHPRCLQKLLDVPAHAHGCPVCQQRYEVRQVTSRVWRYSPLLVACWALEAVFVVGCVAALLVLHDDARGAWKVAIVGTIAAAVVASTGFQLLLARATREEGRLCCVWRAVGTTRDIVIPRAVVEASDELELRV